MILHVKWFPSPDTLATVEYHKDDADPVSDGYEAMTKADYEARYKKELETWVPIRPVIPSPTEVTIESRLLDLEMKVAALSKP